MLPIFAVPFETGSSLKTKTKFIFCENKEDERRPTQQPFGCEEGECEV